MTKYEVWYTTATPDEGYDTLEPTRFCYLASYNTYQEAEERVRDDDDFQCQLWSSGVDVDEYGQPLFIDYYKILDDNGKEIEDA